MEINNNNNSSSTSLTITYKHQHQHQEESSNNTTTTNNNNNNNNNSSGGGPWGISSDWSFEEQAILDQGLTKFGSECMVSRYAKIAVLLPNKSVREVALRCRWMNKKENNKRRKEDITRKDKDKKERAVIDHPAKSSHLIGQSNIPSYAMPTIPTNYGDSISFRAIGGPTGELLEQNAQAFSRISANFAALQIQENINLLCQTRNNILRITKTLNEFPTMMRPMPPLPVRVNEDLANTILPPPSFPIRS
ncbi:hypothetical protein ACFE04_004416 [Oxalis oulophora]